MTGLLHSSESAVIFRAPTVSSLREGFLDAARPSLFERMRTRRVTREMEKTAGAHDRALRRLESLGPDWRVVDLQKAAGAAPMSFLMMGPGGVFAVTVKDHGRRKVSFAGDVVQIDGRRPKYVQQARENARLAAEALTRMAGVSVPVVPILAFAGSGLITFYGLPKGCIVTAYQQLDRVLLSRGRRLARITVDKLDVLASHPATWINNPYVELARRYRWDKDEISEPESIRALKASR
jgi:hypothetical protein